MLPRARDKLCYREISCVTEFYDFDDSRTKF